VTSVPSPIRLLHVLEATIGGTRRHLLDLCAGLPADRFAQHVVYSSIRNPDSEADARRLRDLGIETTPLPLRRSIEPVEDWHCLQALRRIIRDWQPQIVHGHSAKGGFLARLAVRGRDPGHPPFVVYNPHGFAFQMRTSPVQHRLYLWLERCAARYTDALVAVCAGQKALALEHHLLPAEKVTVIPNGLATERFCVPRDRAALRRELGLPEDVTLLGTVAALSPQKGIEYLIRAAAAVRRERPDVHFLIVGEGPLRGSLQRLASTLRLDEGVHFVGARDDVPQLLGALDIFVLPSLWEGLPYALLEAGAAGVPCLATNIPGNADVITPGQTGRLARPADSLDLAVQIFAALGDPGLQPQAEALRSRIREEFSLGGMIAGHVALYERLVAG